MQRNHGGRAVIIGAGRVGSHCALGLITDNTVDEVVLIDQNNAFAVSQAIDLADYSTGIWSDVTVRAGSYQDCDRADVILVTAGRGRRPGETRLQLLNDTLVVLNRKAGHGRPAGQPNVKPRMVFGIVRLTRPDERNLRGRIGQEVQTSGIEPAMRPSFVEAVLAEEPASLRAVIP